MIPIGATIRITKRSHWAFGKRAVVTSLPTIEIGGLDLGELIAFEAVNYWGDVDEHVIGREDCEQVEAAIVPLLRIPSRDGPNALPADPEARGEPRWR